MLKKFIDLIEDLFPCIEPYKAEEVKKAINQFNLENTLSNRGSIHPRQDFPNCFLENAFNFLAQGDIIETLPFIFYDNDTGDKYTLKAKGILLSNTCSASREDNIVFAPLIKIEDTKVDIDSLKKNLVYRCLYFPFEIDDLSNYAIDFSLTQTFPSSIIKKGLQDNKLTKLKSLSAFGYYLFLAKLTVYFMRPEDLSTAEDRINKSIII